MAAKVTEIWFYEIDSFWFIKSIIMHWLQSILHLAGEQKSFSKTKPKGFILHYIINHPS